MERLAESRNRYVCEPCSKQRGTYVIWTEQFLDGFNFAIEKFNFKEK